MADTPEARAERNRIFADPSRVEEQAAILASDLNRSLAVAGTAIREFLRDARLAENFLVTHGVDDDETTVPAHFAGLVRASNEAEMLALMVVDEATKIYLGENNEAEGEEG